MLGRRITYLALLPRTSSLTLLPLCQPLPLHHTLLLSPRLPLLLSPHPTLPLQIRSWFSPMTTPLDPTTLASTSTTTTLTSLSLLAASRWPPGKTATTWSRTCAPARQQLLSCGAPPTEEARVKATAVTPAVLPRANGRLATVLCSSPLLHPPIPPRLPLLHVLNNGNPLTLAANPTATATVTEGDSPARTLTMVASAARLPAALVARVPMASP